MGNYLNLGNDGFQSITKGKYVDKTGLISFVNRSIGTPDKLICVSRPRRFGKSFAVKMISAYYDKSCDSRSLFENYQIAGDPSFETHLNKYNVIYLDITLFMDDVTNAVNKIKGKLLAELNAEFPTVSISADLPETLANIALATGVKFIFLIDEWDALFREAKENTQVQKEYIQLIRSLFKSNLTDKSIAAAYITGILPIKKYGTQSAMTDFQEYNMLCPGPLIDYMGFTSDEVSTLFKNSCLDFEQAKCWYDGYVLGSNTHIYNPKSVMDALHFGIFSNYWTRTETYESLQIQIDLNLDGLKEALVQMLGGARIKIDTATFQNDMTNIRSKDDVMTLLVHLGYLAYNSGDRTVCIPNEEIREEFVRAISTGKHTEIAKFIKNSDRLLAVTLDMDESVVAEEIKKAHKLAADPLYYNNEQALKSVIRFAYISSIDEYVQISEMSGGRGYADLVFLPKRGSSAPVMVIELKWNKTSKSAIEQIKKKDYPSVLADYGGDILLVGINYDPKTEEHTCKIESYEK